MTRLMPRLTLPFALSMVLAASLPASVGAWTASCSSDGVNGNKVCVYRDNNFGAPTGTPLAGMNGSKQRYLENFPNTPDAINNGVSSLRNHYLSKDIRFYHEYDWAGWSWCVDSWLSIGDLGLLDNDKFSSHVVYGNDGAC